MQAVITVEIMIDIGTENAESPYAQAIAVGEDLCRGVRIDTIDGFAAFIAQLQADPRITFRYINDPWFDLDGW